MRSCSLLSHSFDPESQQLGHICGSLQGTTIDTVKKLSIWESQKTLVLEELEGTAATQVFF